VILGACREHEERSERTGSTSRGGHSPTACAHLVDKSIPPLSVDLEKWLSGGAEGRPGRDARVRDRRGGASIEDYALPVAGSRAMA
jgi:hypothetical protein